MPRPLTLHPELTINHTETFLVTARDGQVRERRHGLYHRDVRYLSRYTFALNGAEPLLISASAIDFHLSRSFFTNPRLGAFQTEVPTGELVLLLDRVIDGGGLHEDWQVTNYAHRAMRFTLALTFVATFEDIFEVRASRQGPTDRIVFAHWDRGKRELRYDYRNADYQRALVVGLQVGEEDRPRFTGDGIDLDLVVAPRSEWRMCTDLNFESGERTHGRCMRESGPVRLELHRMLGAPSLLSDNTDLVRAWAQARDDLTALHFQRQGDTWFPAGGIPWYAAVFGRDSLITGYEVVAAAPSLAVGSLLRLGELQADRLDPEREMEPGKIPHELRVGELAHFGKIPHTPSYATADASLLYVIVLHELWRWAGEREPLQRLLPVAERCLEWAARYGDRDGDGLQEYQPHTPRGYRQMGWKDSDDSVVHADGSVAAHPIALVELQGYWYDALLRMAELREAFGGDGEELRAQARAVARRVEELFWMEEEGTYAFALDGAKRQVRGIASNAGHLLWSGLPSPERARRLARRLLADDLWSGWGIRTLSTMNPAYNPIAYHRGTVWPHDNALIAMGLRRYGLLEECGAIAEGLVAAAGRFESGSLPELWSGLPRWPSDFPVLYLDANRPQSWAAAALPLVVRALLGLEVAPRARQLVVDPAIPTSIGRINIQGIPVLGARVSLTASGRILERVQVEGDVEVVRAAG
jgi:glycogen debranching enzyme